jgi:hypothetical protein
MCAGAKLRALASRAAGDDEEAAAAEPSGGEFVSALGVITNEDSSVFQGNEVCTLPCAKLPPLFSFTLQHIRITHPLPYFIPKLTFWCLIAGNPVQYSHKLSCTLDRKWPCWKKPRGSECRNRASSRHARCLSVCVCVVCTFC